MLPYLIAGAIGAGVAMLDKDKKNSRKKYAEGGQTPVLDADEVLIAQP